MESVIQSNGEKSYFLAMPTRANKECTLANCNCWRIHERHSSFRLHSHSTTIAGIESHMSRSCALIEKYEKSGSQNSEEDFLPATLAKKSDCLTEEGFEKAELDLDLRKDLSVVQLPEKRRSNTGSKRKTNMEDNVGGSQMDGHCQMMEVDIAPSPSPDFKHPGVIKRVRRVRMDEIVPEEAQKREQGEDKGSRSKDDIGLGIKRKSSCRSNSSRDKYCRRIRKYIDVYTMHLYESSEPDLSQTDAYCSGADFGSEETDNESQLCLGSNEVACEIFLKEEVSVKVVVGHPQDSSQDCWTKKYYICLICDLLYESLDDAEDHLVEHLELLDRKRKQDSLKTDRK